MIISPLPPCLFSLPFFYGIIVQLFPFIQPFLLRLVGIVFFNYRRYHFCRQLHKRQTNPQMFYPKGKMLLLNPIPNSLGGNTIPFPFHESHSADLSVCKIVTCFVFCLYQNVASTFLGNTNRFFPLSLQYPFLRRALSLLGFKNQITIGFSELDFYNFGELMSLAVLFGDILCLGLWGTCFLKLSKTNMVKDSLQSQKF